MLSNRPLSPNAQKPSTPLANNKCCRIDPYLPTPKTFHTAGQQQNAVEKTTPGVHYTRTFHTTGPLQNADNTKSATYIHVRCLFLEIWWVVKNEVELYRKSLLIKPSWAKNEVELYRRPLLIKPRWAKNIIIHTFNKTYKIVFLGSG